MYDVWERRKDRIKFYKMRTGVTVLVVEDGDMVRVKTWGDLPWGALPVIFSDLEKPSKNYVVDVEENWLYVYSENCCGEVFHFNGYWGNFELKKELLVALVDWARATQKQYCEKKDYEQYGEVWYYNSIKA